MTEFDSSIKSLFGILIDTNNRLKPMARPRTSSKKVPVTLPEGAQRLLAMLVERKLYGESQSEVARYLIISALDELVKNKRLPD